MTFIPTTRTDDPKQTLIPWTPPRCDNACVGRRLADDGRCWADDDVVPAGLPPVAVFYLPQLDR